MILVYEKLLYHYQVYWSKHLEMSRKTEVDYNGQTWASFLCKDGAKAPGIHRRLSAVCGEKSPARSKELKIGKKTDQAAVHE
jgi:hypothetical protein